MLKKINEVREAIKYGLYNCALALALTLPDNCASTEYTDKSNKKEHYVNWFDKYAKPLFTSVATVLPSNEQKEVILLNGEECWNLRCAVLHAGNFRLKNNQIISLHVHTGNTEIHSHSIKDGQYMEYELIELCNNICDAVERYYYENKEKMDSYIEDVRILTW